MMSIELTLTISQVKPFKNLQIYQIFQLISESDIWLKLDEEKAISISGYQSSESRFQPDLEVILLLPDSCWEEQ